MEGFGCLSKGAARAHAKSPPLGSLSAHEAQRDVHATRLLRSHATSTLGSPAVRKETISGATTTHLDLSPCANRHVPAKKTVAVSRREHSWISLRAQEDHRKDCCYLALPPKIDDFNLRTPDPVYTVKRAHVPCAIGNP